MQSVMLWNTTESAQSCSPKQYCFENKKTHSSDYSEKNTFISKYL